MLAVGAGFSSGDFKTLRGDRACKALSLGEVAAAVRLTSLHFTTDIFSAKSRVCICKYSVNE